MKKVLLFLFVALLALSCEKEEKVSTTTYTFKYDIESTSNLDVEVVLFEYNDIGEKIGNNSVEIDGATSKQFTANENTTKVKVYLTASYGDVSESFWVQNVYYLNKNKDTTIEVTGTTMTGKQEP